MASRVQKQIFIGFIYIVLFAAVSAGIMFGMGRGGEDASCFDDLKNQTEEGIDCGGVCPACQGIVGKPIKDLIVRQAHIVPVGEKIYDAFAVVENPNGLYGGEEVAYLFTFIDGQGGILRTVRGKTYIYPQEERFIITQAIALSSPPAQVLFDVEGIVWREVTETFSLDWIEVVDEVFQMHPTDDPSAYAKLSGIVVNGAPYNVRSIEVEMVLYNDAAKPIAVHRTDVQTMLRDERRFFEVVWPAALPGEAKNFVVFAHTNFFLDQNFIEEYSSPEKFQEYYR